MKGRPRQFDKEEALDIALKCFWEHGYEGTSIAMLANAIGIKIPSLYAAFGNKESLFLQAVERYIEADCKAYTLALEEKTARAVAKMLFESAVELVTRESCPSGCMMIQAALATSPESEQISQTLSNLRKRAESAIAERMEKAKTDGDLPSSADAKALAQFIMTINAGLSVQAKSGATKEQLERVVAIALGNWPENNENRKFNVAI